MKRRTTMNAFSKGAIAAVAGGFAALFLFSGPSGGNIKPLRVLQDPYPTFTDIAVDPENNLIVVSDENRFTLSTYRRDLLTRDVAEPMTVISGPNTGMDFACGVAIDPVSRELYTVSNDTGADMVVFGYEANGEALPLRVLHAASRGSWGVSVDRIHDEVAISVEHINKVVIYRRTAEGDEKPLRVIQGPSTELTDPHGVFLDGKNNEIFVANHDSWHEVQIGEGDPYARQGESTGSESFFRSTGKFVDFAIRVYSRMANGNVAPLRTIQGTKTQLNLPMKIHVDTIHNEIVVANSGGDSILVFGRTAEGNVAPLREIKGPSTGLDNPTGVYIDTKNDEIWVACPGTHTLTVYSRTADGDAAPLRVIRAAPEGTPAVGIGNPGGVAYDPIRKQILVPN